MAILTHAMPFDLASLCSQFHKFSRCSRVCSAKVRFLGFNIPKNILLTSLIITYFIVPKTIKRNWSNL